MKRSTRIVSLLLVLLMLVGMMPLSLLAAGTKTSSGGGTTVKIHDGLSVKLPTEKEITDAGAEKLILTGFDSAADSSFTATTAGNPAPTRTELGGNKDYTFSGKLQLINRTEKSSFYYTEESDGNKALKIVPYGDSTALGKELYVAFNADTKRKDFVLSYDIKLDSTLAANGGIPLFNLVSRFNGSKAVTGPQGNNLLFVQPDGSINTKQNGSGTAVGYLNSNTYTTVALQVNLVANKYYVYMNGVKTYEATFLDSSKLLNYSKAISSGGSDGKSLLADYSDAALTGETFSYTADGVTYSDVLLYDFKPEYYYLEVIRMYQFNPVSNSKNSALWIDNVAFYAKSATAAEKLTYLGAETDTYTDGIVKDGGNFYYVKKGSRFSKPTAEIYNIDGLGMVKTDKTGKLFAVSEKKQLLTAGLGVTNVVYDTKTNIYKFGAGAGMNLTASLNVGAKTQMSIVQALEYDALELLTYTASPLDDTLLFFNLHFGTVVEDSAEKGAYYDFCLNLGENAISGEYYTSKGEKKSFTYNNPIGQGYNVNYRVIDEGGSRIKAVKAAYNDIQDKIAAGETVSETDKKRGILSTFNIDSQWGNTQYQYDADGNRLINASYDSAVTGLNFIKFSGYASDVEQLTGTGWTIYLDTAQEKVVTLYRDPKTYKVVKNTSVEVHVDGDPMAYTFDANGELVGKYSGHLVGTDGFEHIYVNGVMAKGDSKGRYVDNGKVVTLTQSGIYVCEGYYDYTPANAYSPVNYATAISGNKMYASFEGADYITQGGSSASGGSVDGAIDLCTKGYITTGGTFVGVLRSTTASIKDSSNGTKALYVEKTAYGNHSYMVGRLKNAPGAETMVVDMDLQLGDNWNCHSGELVQFINRSDAGNNDIGNFLSIDKCGNLIFNNRIAVAQLSRYKFTRISCVVKHSVTSENQDQLKADIYINGVRLISDELFASPKFFVGFNDMELRMFQYNGTDPFSYWLDNLCIYAADAPVSVAAEGSVTLQNGFVDEGDIVRYYENGLFVRSNTFEAKNEKGVLTKYTADPYGAINKFKNVKNLSWEYLTKDGYFTYDAEVADNVFHDSKGLGQVMLKFPSTPLKGYNKFMVDVYIPEGNAPSEVGSGKGANAHLTIVVGEDIRWYRVDTSTAGGEGSNIIGSVDLTGDDFVYSGVIDKSTTTCKDKLVYQNGSSTATTARIGQDDDGNYYVRKYTYNYQQINLSDYTVGWHTIEINIDQSLDLEAIQLESYGWSAGEGLNWYGTSEGKYNHYEKYNGDAIYDIRYANLRLVAEEDSNVGANVGWQEDNTYVSSETFEPLKGIAKVDGLYYDFGDDGVSKGVLNGLNDFATFTRKSVSGSDATWVKSTEQRMFVNGKLLTVSKAGNTLTMDGMIGVNYYLNINEIPTDGTYVEFTVNGNTYTVLLKDLISTDDGYKATVYVPAAEMTKKISAVVKAEDGTVLATLADYTAKDAAMAYVNGEYDANVKAAAKAMLNYAAAAQIYFNVETTDLANKDLNEADKTVTVDAASVSGSYAVSGSVIGATYRSSQLGLQAATVLYHNFVLAEGASIDDYTVTVSGGLTAEKELVDGKMRIKITGIAASDLDTAYTVTVTRGDESVTVTYSATKYVQLVLANESQLDANLVSLAKALYSYNVAADAYVNANQTSGASLAGSDHTFLY